MGRFSRNKDRDYRDAARLLADGKTSEAIKQLKIIIAKKPDHTNALTSLAVALLQMQDKPDKDNPLTKEALTYLDRAAASDPKNPVPYFNRGVCLRDLGLLDDALESFQAALDIHKRLTLAILHMAEINYELERWEKAVEFARLALIRDPGIEDALSWVPEAMRKAGLLEDDESKSELQEPHGENEIDVE